MATLLPAIILPLFAAEARLELPDPVIPGVVMEGRIVVENAESAFKRADLPVVAGIEWQARGARSSQTTIINGKASHTQSQGIVLRIAKPGTYQIPAIHVLLGDGSTLATAPVTVTCKEGDASLEGEAKAEAFFEPATIVPGQPTSLILRLHLLQGQIRNLGIGPPAQAITLGERTIKEGQVHDTQGQRWTVVTITWPITFTAPDTVTVSGQQPYEITVGNGFFDTRVIRRQIPVKPATLTVTALPAEGRPADFTGLIGAVAVTSALDRTRIATGEGALLSVTYQGRGVELLSRPALPAIAGLTTYAKDDDKDEAKPGERTFRWDLVPANAGTITIPAFSVPFFDPGSRTYRRAASEPLVLTVVPGRSRTLDVAGKLPADAAAAATAPTTVTLTGIAALPPPLRGTGAAAVPWHWHIAVLITGLLIGTIIGLASRIAGSLRRGPHRGRLLAEAITAGDLDRIANALHQLMPALADDARRDAARRLQQAVDLARFGRQPLAADAATLAKTLEDVA